MLAVIILRFREIAARVKPAKERHRLPVLIRLPLRIFTMRVLLVHVVLTRLIFMAGRWTAILAVPCLAVLHFPEIAMGLVLAAVALTAPATVPVQMLQVQMLYFILAPRVLPLVPGPALPIHIHRGEDVTSTVAAIKPVIF